MNNEVLRRYFYQKGGKNERFGMSLLQEENVKRPSRK